MKIKFGPNQRRFPIPRSVDWKISVSIELIAWLGVVFNSEIVDSIGMNETWQHTVTQMANLTIALLMRLKPWFGVETTKKSIDIEHVDVMEDKPK